MIVIRSRKASERQYRQRNRQKIRRAEQTRRDNRRGGPRMCARCHVNPPASPKHHYCADCKVVIEAKPSGSRWPQDDRPATERGYGPHHAKTRAKWAKVVEAGDAFCVRCHGPIAPGSHWHLDHKDDRSSYLGPSHARCNIRAGARKGHALSRTAAERVDQTPRDPNHSRAWL